MKKTNIVFMGTPDIAVPTLEALNKKYNISAVVTVPDKPKGRGMKLLPSDIKIKATELELPILQPIILKDISFITNLKELNPDIIVVFAFRFLPKEVYEIANIAAFNIHTSLLPKYRGAAPINWAIINGEKNTGLTSFILDDKIDTGPIILQKEITISDNSTAGDLYNIMKNVAPDFAITTCEKLLTNQYTITHQNQHNNIHPAPKLFRENVEINWEQSATTITNFINGCSPVPCAWTTWEDKKLQIIRAKVSNNIEEFSNKKAGEFYILSDNFLVNSKNGIVELIEIKLENKNAMFVENFLNGFRGNKTGMFKYAENK